MGWKKLLGKKMNSFYNIISTINSSIKRKQYKCVFYPTVRSTKLLVFLRSFGFINNFQASKNKGEVFLKYYQDRPVLKQIISISKPGRRVHPTISDLSLLVTRNLKNNKKINVLFVLDTKYGFLSHKQALNLNCSGELLCSIII